MGAMHHHQWQQMGIQSDGWLQALFELSVFGYKISFWGIETREACHTKFPIVATM
jgi:hypothetical protein